MREYGVGVLNGSLWTISVELQFYILVPLIYLVFGIGGAEGKSRALVLLVCFFLVFYLLRLFYMPTHGESLVFRLFSVSFAPWFWMFLVGVVFQKNFKILHRMLSGRALVVLPVYILFAWYTADRFEFGLGNEINPVSYLLLASLVFSFAYTAPHIGRAFLRGNDISYGVYIYHMPVVNLFVFYGFVGAGGYIAAVVLITILLASASWFAVEKNLIRFKKSPFHSLTVMSNSAVKRKMV
jgi:peptidoglycan/LPS O-acetylase OafA/YrhL